MKISSTLLLLVFSFGMLENVSLAQNVTVTNSEELTNVVQDATITKALGKDDTGYYLMHKYGSVSNETIVIEKFDLNFKRLFSSEFPANSGSINDSKLERSVEMINGQIYLFSERWNKALQQNAFVVQRINEKGYPEEQEIIIETEPSSGLLKNASYSINISPDGHKLAILTQKTFTKGTNETIRLQVFNTNGFSSLWKQDLTLENESKRNPINEICVNNNGVVFLLQDIKITLKEHQYRLVTTSSKESLTSNINLDAFALGQFKLTIDNDGQLIACGTLTPLGYKNTACQGTWFMKADENGKIIQNKTTYLSKDLLRVLVNKPSIEKAGFNLNDFSLKDVIIKPDNGVLLLVEQKQSSNVVIGQNPMPIYEYTLIHGDVFVISYDKSGNELWHNVLQKQQTERTANPNKFFGSFAYQLKDGNLFLVWNFTNYLTDPPLNRYRYWIDRNGSKINIDNLFGKDAYYPTLLTVIDSNGNLSFNDKTFNSLPLDDIQKTNSFSMAVDPHFYFIDKDGMIIMSHTPGIQSKRFKFSTLRY